MKHATAQHATTRLTVSAHLQPTYPPPPPHPHPQLFFSTAADLVLLEIDPSKFAGPVNWIVGKMGDEQPDAAAQAGAPTTVHYLLPDGCVHV